MWFFAKGNELFWNAKHFQNKNLKMGNRGMFLLDFVISKIKHTYQKSKNTYHWKSISKFVKMLLQHLDWYTNLISAAIKRANKRKKVLCLESAQVFAFYYWTDFVYTSFFFCAEEHLVYYSIVFSTLKCESYLELVIYSICSTGNCAAWPCFLKTVKIVKKGDT